MEHAAGNVSVTCLSSLLLGRDVPTADPAPVLAGGAPAAPRQGASPPGARVPVPPARLQLLGPGEGCAAARCRPRGPPRAPTTAPRLQQDHCPAHLHRLRTNLQVVHKKLLFLHIH